MGSAASAPAELLLAAALHDRPEEEPHDIGSAGSLMPSPSAPSATNSLLERLLSPDDWQKPEGGGGGSSGGGSVAAGSGGAAAGAGAAGAAVPPGKGAAAAEQPAEGGSPKGTIEAIVALGLADSGVTDEQEEQQLGSSGGSTVGAPSSGSGSISAAVAAAMGAAEAASLPSEGSSDSAGRALGVLRSNASCMVDIRWEGCAACA